jgi:7-cyano-7-deazaguanine synthase
MSVSHAVVLLSGGLDSSAALVWTQARSASLRAISFDYCQPNRDREIPAAQAIAAARGVPLVLLHLADALSAKSGLLAGLDLPPGGGIAPAFIVGRNMLFATVAAAHAATWWPRGRIDIVIGACASDQAGFPDCRPNTMHQLAAALSAGCGRDIRIVMPWADSSKSQILYAIEPDAEALRQVCASWSCYRKHGPCGECGACALRAEAFAARGVQDLCVESKMVGGDSHRERP